MKISLIQLRKNRYDPRPPVVAGMFDRETGAVYYSTDYGPLVKEDIKRCNELFNGHTVLNNVVIVQPESFTRKEFRDFKKLFTHKLLSKKMISQCQKLKSRSRVSKN